MKRMRNVVTVGLGIVAAAAAISLAVAAQPEKTAKPDAPRKAAEKSTGDPYSLGTCPISGKDLGSMGDPVVKLYDGREVRFCCDKCPPSFEKDQAKSMAKLDEAMIKDQTPHYPLDTCLIDGKKLEAGKTVDFVHGNRLVRVCSDGDKAAFLKDPAANLSKLDKAVIAAQTKGYKLKACPVSKDELGSMGDNYDLVVANRLVRLCCEDCVPKVKKNPAKFIEIGRAHV